MTDVACDVAVIGAGPAGLAAATELRRRGIEKVLVLERDTAAGGRPRLCGHPPFGLREYGRVLSGPAYARRLTADALAAGVEIRLGHSVAALRPGGRIDLMTPAGPAILSARRVIVATGARETPRSALMVSGDRPAGIMTTGSFQAFVYGKGIVPFRRPLIVGSELVTLSALMSCRTAGIEPVAMIEQRARPLARWPLTLFPHLLRIPVHYGARIVDIEGRAQVESVTIATADGTMKKLACDGVLFTGRFVPEASLVAESHLVFDRGSAGPSLDQFGRCSDPVYFAAGNVTRAVETAGRCFREGRQLARVIVEDLAARAPVTIVTVDLTTSGIVKYVVPQRLTIGAGRPARINLQLRVDEPATGTIEIASGERVVVRRRLAAKPERRISLRLDLAALPPDASALTVGMGGGPACTSGCGKAAKPGASKGNEPGISQ
ncbi:NAD(P)/FAD-dependent oxidoreductase [Phreatobacter stygius]|uniref:FAD-dependent oxidoreductase n=1 Tax=Phreatobacter stygius TaxID=1940610 RepID=A0A4D7AWE5_9HYPH|nr:FAD-dependent oxidoreductase [Phreatobacter stygius]QCI63835.1 FAD-dependent oxidoreductase [Phreatobacter stygius]